MTQGVIVNR